MESVKKLVEFTPLLYIDKLYNTHLGIWIQYELDKKGENKKIPYISVSLGFGKPSEFGNTFEFFDFLGNVLKEKYYKNENNIRNEVQQIRKKEINVLLELLPEKTITTLFEKIC